MKDKNDNEILCKYGSQNAIKNDKVILELLKKYHIDANDFFFQLLLNWPKIAKEGFSNHVKPFEYKENILIVICDNSSWASQLQFEKRRLMKKIQEVFPEQKVKNIKPIVKKV